MPIHFSINKSDSKQQSQKQKTKNIHDVSRERIFNKDNTHLQKYLFPLACIISEA